MTRDTRVLLVGLAFYGLFFGTVITMIAALITHIIVCIQSAAYLLLIAGAIVAPVGVIHGVGYWFGAW